MILETRETARGLIVNVSDVLFDTGSATLKPGAREKLARVAGILASHPDLRFEIEGHTDSVGGDDYNQPLSERRAESVRTYLMQQRSQRSPSMLGSVKAGPVASNATPAGRQQNRRVELVCSVANPLDGPRPAVPPGSSACSARVDSRAAACCPRRLGGRAAGETAVHLEAWPRGSKPVSWRRCCCFAARAYPTIRHARPIS